MSRLPTPTAVAHLVDSLRALNEPPARGQPKRIDTIEARLVAAIRRDVAGLPDGYRTGRARPSPADPDEPDDPATTVEAAMLARDQRPFRDRHHQLTVRAVRALDQAVVAIQVVFSVLTSIEALIDPTPVPSGPPAPKTCDHCTGKRGKGGDRPIAVRGTVGNRLERALGLCTACYSFVTQTAKAGSRQGYLPSDEQITHHEETGRWRIRVLPRH